jgi:hypothetical protein
MNPKKIFCKERFLSNEKELIASALYLDIGTKTFIKTKWKSIGLPINRTLPHSRPAATTAEVSGRTQPPDSRRFASRISPRSGS